MASSLIPRRCLAQTARLCRHSARRSAAALPPTLRPSAAPRPVPQRPFSLSALLGRGIMPDSSVPTTKDSPSTEQKHVVPALSDDAYHDLADRYLDNVLSKFEQHQESREDLDVEYASGVMTITVADKGVFVINKQPPNRQIWLSSPLSGPKRYDWTVVSEGQGDKEGTALGYWTYARDGSTLDALILEETGVDVQDPENTAL